jgi:uncharacterized protein YdiU (UPF0061 family)
MTTSTLVHIFCDSRVTRKVPVAPMPADPLELHVPQQVTGACFAFATPVPLTRPRLAAYSPSALALIGVSVPAAEGTPQHAEWAAELAGQLGGSVVPEGAKPVAHCYCGFQFGSFAGQLGDGAAISLGEVVASGHESSSSSSSSSYEINLKGTGPTVFCRGADGRKVIRSTIREFVGSEALHHLGIPTTRAAACVVSDTTVERDPAYTGNVIRERCAVVARLAPSFFRFGSFDICRPADPAVCVRAGPSCGQLSVLEKLFDFVAESFFAPQQTAAKRTVVAVADATAAVIAEKEIPLSWKEQSAVNIFQAVVDSTAELVSKWQAVGFTHGVLNTDNMSIHGLTLDYGPFAFMSYYDPDFVANSSDHEGRYCFAQQPAVCKWNLERLLESFTLLFPRIEKALKDALGTYDSRFEAAEARIWRQKLGLVDGHVAYPASAVLEVKTKLLDVMKVTWADFNKTIRVLGTELPAAYFASVHGDAGSRQQHLTHLAEAIATKLCAAPQQICVLLESRASKRQQLHPQQIRQILELVEKQPAVASAILGGAPVAQIKTQFEAEQIRAVKDAERRQSVAKWRTTTLAEKQKADTAAWYAFLEYYTNMVALSTDAQRGMVREAAMNGANPAFVPYSWILQSVIDATTNDDHSVLQELVRRVETPFVADDARDEKLWSLKPPADLSRFCLSCSS